MFYLVMQILVFLVVAVSVGCVLGWMLRAVLKPAASASPRAATADQLSRARETAKIARSELAAKAEMLTKISGELAERNSEIKILQRALQEDDTAASTVPKEQVSVEDVLESAGLPTSHKRGVAQRDNLSKIRGIGPVTEKLLNELGYSTFEQVANWTEEDIDRIAEQKSSLRAKIEREEWPKWARKRYKDTNRRELR